MTNRIRIRPEELLGLKPGADPGDISRARARLARLLHPDLNDGETTAIMQLINHAVEVLMSGQDGIYSFGNPGQPEGPGEESREPERKGWDSREGQGGQGKQDSQGNGSSSGAGANTCTHPRKPGYDQCFNCSGVKLCTHCGNGYYKPPNDRCRTCRNKAWQERQRYHRYRGDRR